MPVSAISNANLLQMCYDCGAVGFLPVLTYTYDAETGDVVVTNDSDIPAGDTLKRIQLRLTDDFGNEVRGTTTSAAVTISAATLDKSKGLNLTATILTNGGIAADGSAFFLQAAGNVGRWDVQKNALA